MDFDAITNGNENGTKAAGRAKKTESVACGQTHPFSFKCVLLGQAAVGKTCLANKVATGKFINSPITTFTSSFINKSVTLTSGAIVNMELWDTAGQERYRSLTNSFFRDAKAILIMYDADAKRHLGAWLKEVDGHVAIGEALVFLVGTKLDLGRARVELTKADVESLTVTFCEHLEIAGHFVLSSKTGENVDETLREVAETVWQAVWESKIQLRRKDTIRLGDDAKNKDSESGGSGCCKSS